MAESPKRRVDAPEGDALRSSSDAPHASKPVCPSGRSSAETAREADCVTMPAGPFAVLPTQFGPYEVRRELARGQLGAAYLALDIELNRLVILTFPRVSESGSVKLMKRMEIDANPANNVDHPHIFKVYGEGEIDGIRFIAMQYIDGDDLRRFMKRVGRNLEPYEAARLVLPILRALMAAHDKGVIHRDLKPENVMLDKKLGPVIVAFGLGLNTTASSNLLSVGTAGYMSPEQATGKMGEIDHRTDIYAVGVMLFEMLTGELPFTGGAIEMMVKKCVHEPPSPLLINPKLNPQLAAVCHKMILSLVIVGRSPLVAEGSRFISTFRRLPDLSRAKREQFCV